MIEFSRFVETWWRVLQAPELGLWGRGLELLGVRVEAREFRVSGLGLGLGFRVLGG